MIHQVEPSWSLAFIRPYPGFRSMSCLLSRSRCSLTRLVGVRGASNPSELWCVQRPLMSLLFCAALSFVGRGIVASEDAFFENHVRPLFARHCVGCHGPKKRESGLRLDRRDGFFQGGDHGPAVVPGSPGESRLILAVRRDGKLQMPPEESLERAEVDVLVRWVELGAPWPEDLDPESFVGPKIRGGPITDEDRQHWAFQPVVRPERPDVSDESWPRTPVDRFIREELDRQGLPVTSLASKRALLRRATFGLTGLPPTPEEIEGFLDDSSPEAFAKVVERLLRSPHYGERWGRHWLDVVRYADTAGETADYPVPLAWRYRNYVIDAFNQDKPYDEFLREQIAGDILARSASRDRYAELVTATGYLAISRRFGFGIEKYQYLTIQDTIDTTGQAVLGLSLGCARCHDHKYDAIDMADYYSWYGIFESTSYALPACEGQKEERNFVPAVPAEEAKVRKAAHDAEFSGLGAEIKTLEEEREKLGGKLRLRIDDDPGFELQALDSRPVEPWSSYEGARVTLEAQSPFRNVFFSGSRGLVLPANADNGHFGRSIQPARKSANFPRLFFNIDFRNLSPDTGTYRFYLGHGSGESPAVEVAVSATTFRVKDGGEYRKIRVVELGQWYNVQLELDLAAQTYSGTVGRPGDIVRFDSVAFSDGWDGTIDRFFADAGGPVGGVPPARQFDNYSLRSAPLLPVGKEVVEKELAVDRWTDEVDARLLPQAVPDADAREGFHVWRVEPLPVVALNVSDRTLKLPGIVPSGALVVHPDEKVGVAIVWRSPIDGVIRIGGRVSDVHDCGNSVLWFLDHLGEYGFENLVAGDLPRGSQQDFSREAKGALDHVEIREGDFLQLVILPKEDLGCDMTRIELEIDEVGGCKRSWDLVQDVSGDFLEENPHTDSLGNPRVWHFCTAAIDRGQEFAAKTEFAKTMEELREPWVGLARIQNRLAVIQPRHDVLGKSGPYDLIYGVVEGEKPADAKIQLRGDPKTPADETPRRNLDIFGAALIRDPEKSSGRLDLAHWLSSAENPLTARVMVNRIWQHHFGRGIVETSNDFGVRGRPPTHPKLLDWLAAEFVASGWSVKHMQRVILGSRVYQLSSMPDPTRNLSDADEHARTRLFGRYPRRRLEAEAIRDAMLAVSGLLDRTPGEGHPFPAASTWTFSQTGPFYAVYPTTRRSVYLMTQRLLKHPFLGLFDGADTNSSTALRTQTTTPTQALYLINNEFVHEQAVAFGARLLERSKNDEERVRFAFETALGRQPRVEEVHSTREFLSHYLGRLASTGTVTDDVQNREAWAAFVRTLLVRNEFLYLE